MIRLGDNKGLYYKANYDAIDCMGEVRSKLNFGDSQFVQSCNRKFKTTKFISFVHKWLSAYIYDLVKELHIVSRSEYPSSLSLANNQLNHIIIEWWKHKYGSTEIRWIGQSELWAGIQAISYVVAYAGYTLFSRGICLVKKREQFKVMKETCGGLNLGMLSDDFFVDGRMIGDSDLLLYSLDRSGEPRISAFEDAMNSQYACVDAMELKIPASILWRLIKYHFIYPLVFILVNFRRGQNYLTKEWLRQFCSPAVIREVIMGHYKVGVNLSSKEVGLSLIPETIALNQYGTKNALYHWSDLTGYLSADHQYKAPNLFLAWGSIHYKNKNMYADEVEEIGCWLLDDYTKIDKYVIRRKLGLENDSKVILFYDSSSFSPDYHFTEAILLDYWQMLLLVLERNEDMVAVAKPKTKIWISESRLSDGGKDTLRKIRERCLETNRFCLINNPEQLSITEALAISDMNVSMGMTTPSTLALLCGGVGLYYDTTGADYHPLAREYKGTLVFDDKLALSNTIRGLLDKTLKLPQLNSLLKSYDKYRDNKGLQRFREALLEVK